MNVKLVPDITAYIRASKVFHLHGLKETVLSKNNFKFFPDIVAVIRASKIFRLLQSEKKDAFENEFQIGSVIPRMLLGPGFGYRSHYYY